jgi:hypothetical protein
MASSCRCKDTSYCLDLNVICIWVGGLGRAVGFCAYRALRRPAAAEELAEAPSCAAAATWACESQNVNSDRVTSQGRGSWTAML